jgi:aminoglycoside/choline kinase family phosphotransferase
MTDRNDQMDEFLAASGWGDAKKTPLAGDASTRRYVRLERAGRTAMLMDQPQNAEAKDAPPDASPEERARFGYNALARLAAGDVGRYIAVASFLRKQGLTAPEIIAADPRAGFAVIEDLGDDLYANVLSRGGDERALYASAADVLARLHEDRAPAVLAPGKPLFPYDETAQLAEISLLTEWFFPFALGREAAPDEITEHRALWQKTLRDTIRSKPVLVHRDYHAENLIWLPNRDGVQRVGLIDFQDAVAGSQAQDLMHLLEDARRDVSPETTTATVRHYFSTMKAKGLGVDEESFRAEMAAISGQRNARIVGIFARLYKRDGKPRYLQFLPRVWGHLNRDLENPAMAELSAWYAKTIPMALRTATYGAAA